MQPGDRCSYRMYRLRKDRLGDDYPDLLDSCPPKPRWMRRRTYERLTTIDDARRMQRDALVMGWLVKCATV
jgi:hypothetical protein